MTTLDLAEWNDVAGVELSADQVAALTLSDFVTIRPDVSRPGRWIVRARHHVGATTIAGVAIRIAPKVPVRRLISLITRHIELARLDENDTTWATDDDVPTALATAFATHTERVLATGILQGYRTTDEALLTVRGRIAMSRQVSVRAGLALPVEVTYDDYTTDIVENQLLAGATEQLLLLALPDPIRHRLRVIRAAFADVAPARPSPAPAAVIWTRINERYRLAVALARTILRSSTMDTGQGRQVMATGLMIDMNLLFESVTGSAVRTALDPRAGAVCTQRHDRLDVDGHLAIRPDIVIERHGTPISIADAKYKRPDLSGIDGHDVYQVLAYAHRYELDAVHLVYPVRTPHGRLRVGRVDVHLHHLDLDQADEDVTRTAEAITRALLDTAGAPVITHSHHRPQARP